MASVDLRHLPRPQTQPLTARQLVLDDSSGSIGAEPVHGIRARLSADRRAQTMWAGSARPSYRRASTKADSMIDINRFIDTGFRRYSFMFIGGDAGASLPETTTTGMPRRTGSFTPRLRKPRPSSTGIDISRTMSKGTTAIVLRRSMAFCPF